MRIRRELALLSFLGLVACGSGGTHVTFNGSEPDGSEGSPSLNAHMEYQLTTDATYFSLLPFGDNLIVNATGEAIVVVDPDGNDIESRAAEGLYGLSADPIAGSVAFFDKSGINFLESVSGTGWSVALPKSLELYKNAVQGGDVVIAGRAEEPTSIGCSSDAHGVFLARYRGKRCIDIWSPVRIDQGAADPDHTPISITAMSFAPDGSLALGGWFRRQLFTDSQVFNSAGADDIFLTVLEPDGSVRFTRVAGDNGIDRLGSLAWNADGTKVFVGGMSASKMDFGDGEKAEGDGDGFVSSFDANSGAHLWNTTVWGSDNPETLALGGVDQDRVLVSAPSCREQDLSVRLPSDTTGKTTCIGALDTNTGAKLYMMELGPSLWNTKVLGGNGGFWLATSFEGRPDFGNGKVAGGHEVFARYVFR